MIISGYQRYIGVTDEEEAIVLRALEVHRNLLRNLCQKSRQKGVPRAHRILKNQRLETIEALMDRVFPTGETEAEAFARLEREAEALPPDPKRDRIMRRLVDEAMRDHEERIARHNRILDEEKAKAKGGMP